MRAFAVLHNKMGELRADIGERGLEGLCLLEQSGQRGNAGLAAELMEHPAAKARASQPRFIELPSLPTRRAEHVVELEDATGRKLSLKIPAGHLAEVLPLAQAFWRPGV